ncbi:MAG: DUF1805 domain-containing protein [Planctomycetota bacterium]
MPDIDFEGLQTVNHPLKRPLLVVSAAKGSVCCGYISLEALNRNGDAAAIVRGVENHEQMLTATIKFVSDAAAEFGVEVGMTGKEALERFSQ